MGRGFTLIDKIGSEFDRQRNIEIKEELRFKHQSSLHENTDAYRKS